MPAAADVLAAPTPEPSAPPTHFEPGGANPAMEATMAVNKPVGDNARKGAVKKRSQTRTKMGKAKTWTKRKTTSGEFMAVKKSSTKKSAKKFKGVRREKA
jgi:hypothetical protein